MDYISVLVSNRKLLLEALSKTDATGSSSLCDEAASQLHMTVYNIGLHITNHKAMADVGSMDTVMILKRFIHAERAGL